MYKPPKGQSNFDDVGDFHDRFGLDSVTHYEAGPRNIDPELLKFRLGFMLEEFMELLEAVGADLDYDSDTETHHIRMPEELNIDHAKAFDALIDEAYVTFGLAHLLGYPWQVGWSLVQAANMRKVRAERAEQSERGGTWDVVKPDGWMPPNIEGALYAWGFNPDLANEPIEKNEDDQK